MTHADNPPTTVPDGRQPVDAVEALALRLESVTGKRIDAAWLLEEPWLRRDVERYPAACWAVVLGNRILRRAPGHSLRDRMRNWQIWLAPRHGGRRWSRTLAAWPVGVPGDQIPTLRRLGLDRARTSPEELAVWIALRYAMKPSTDPYVIRRQKVTQARAAKLAAADLATLGSMMIALDAGGANHDPRNLPGIDDLWTALTMFVAPMLVADVLHLPGAYAADGSLDALVRGSIKRHADFLASPWGRCTNPDHLLSSPMFTPPPWAGLVRLECMDDLANEGVRMNHCLGSTETGSWRYRAVTELLQFFHYQHMDGSTATIACDRHGCLLAARGPRNGSNAATRHVHAAWNQAIISDHQPSADIS